jgi:flagellar hook-associated protein 2
VASETVADGDVAAGLSRFNFDPTMLDGGQPYGMAASTNQPRYGQDAKARINGLAVTSSTNTLTNNIPGVTINLSATTTTNYNNVGGAEARASITMAIREDVTPSVKNVQDFITAYNALSATLADLTKYDAATKTPSLFQGDAAILGLQSVLRSMVGSISSGSTYQRLADVGVERQLDGSLSMNTTKLSAAANNGTELQKLFTTDNKNPLTNGFALKFSALGKGVLASGGSVTNKALALQKELDRNGVEQTRVNDRAAAFEARLRKQYSALDAKMASLSALNSYVAQQVTTWNKSGN